MEYLWINNYSGIWEDDEGRKLVITPHDDENAKVDLLVNEKPMARPWKKSEPAINMHGIYDPAEGPGLTVDLGRPGFTLDLNFEYPDLMNPDAHEELSVGVSWRSSDKKAEVFMEVFGKLNRYHRVAAAPGSVVVSQGRAT